VALVCTRNPLNIGAAARAMSNFGFHDLRLVQPFEPSFREARSAVGASEILAAAREFASVAEAVADCTLVVGTTSADRRQLQHELKPLDEAPAFICRQAKGGRVALLFGSEKRGLSNDDFSHCHWLLRIPTRAEHGSMNLGQAVAVVLYELARVVQRGGGRGKTTARTKSGTSDQMERIASSLLAALEASGYTSGQTTAVTTEKIRRMVHRLRLSIDDAELWMGMLRQILWKLKRGE